MWRNEGSEVSRKWCHGKMFDEMSLSWPFIVTEPRTEIVTRWQAFLKTKLSDKN
jgi:hypothetical protein